MFPARTSNQITKEYYYFLKEQINKNTCFLSVCEVKHSNGTYKYFPYHLTSSL